MNAYKVAGHQHVYEIERELSLVAEQEIRITFTPHVVPQCRGILTTIYAQLKSEFDAGDFELGAEVYSVDLLPASYDDWVLEARARLLAGQARESLAATSAFLAEHGESMWVGRMSLSTGSWAPSRSGTAVCPSPTMSRSSGSS